MGKYWADKFDDLNPTQQSELLNWCNKLEKTKKLNLRHTAYGLKHVFESCPCGFYVIEEVFHEAMIRCGFKSDNDRHYNFNEHIYKHLVRKK